MNFVFFFSGRAHRSPSPTGLFAIEIIWGGPAMINPQNARRGYREREMRRKAKSGSSFRFPEEENPMSDQAQTPAPAVVISPKSKTPWGWILGGCGCLGSCVACLALVAFLIWNPFGWFRTTATQTPAAPAAPASPTTSVWDPSCKTQSTLMGVTLTPLQEGPAVACIWSGSPVTITVPTGTFADVDLGGVFVAQGPSQPITGVGRITLRQWISGGNAELCSHLEALNQYLETQPGFAVAAPLNFTCDAK